MADLMKALRNAHDAGDTKAASRIAAMIKAQKQPEESAVVVENAQEAMPVEGERSTWDKIKGVADVGATMASGVLAEPLAGLAGIAGTVLPGDTGQGAEWVESARDSMTYNPKTEAGQEYLQSTGEFLQPVADAMEYVESGLGDAVLEATGSPALAAAAHSIPTAALEAMGIKKAFAANRAAARTANNAPPVQPTPDINAAVDEKLKGFNPKGFKTSFSKLDDAAKQEQLVKAMKSGDKTRIAAMIDADPKIAEAMIDLGLKEPGIPSAQSRSSVYQETEQALKKIPGSQLSKLEKDSIAELQQRADSLIEEFGGNTDKSEVSLNLAERSKKDIDDLNSVTKQAYDDIGENIPRNTTAKLDNTKEALRTELSDLGGDIDQLSPLEKRLLKMADNDNLTYHAVDKIRKQIGETIGKQSDVFKSESSGSLKRLYRLLSDDQGVTVNDLGMGDQWKAAKELVQKRKGIEDNAVKMFGKNLSDSFMPKMGLAVKKMTGGDYKKFNELLQSVPKDMRGEVVVSALNDAFTMGSRKEKSLNIAGFDDYMNGLNKNPRAKKMLFDELPPEMKGKLDSLHKVSAGIRKAQASAPVGGQVMASQGVWKNLNQGVMSMVGKFLPGFAGAAADAVASHMKGSSFNKAMDVLSDPDFVRAIEATAKGQKKKAAALEKRLMRKKSFSEFAKTLPPEAVKSLPKVGLMTWLAKAGEDSQTEEE